MSELTLQMLAQKKVEQQLAPTMFELEGKEIRPCPFCGGIEITVSYWMASKDCTEFFCRCTSCNAAGPSMATGKPQQDRRIAIRRWQEPFGYAINK